MKDLIDFNRFQIEALQAEICKLKQENNLLATYCFEALSFEVSIVRPLFYFGVK